MIETSQYKSYKIDKQGKGFVITESRNIYIDNFSELVIYLIQNKIRLYDISKNIVEGDNNKSDYEQWKPFQMTVLNNLESKFKEEANKCKK